MMRKLAREAEAEQEDPDKYYKEVDESQPGRGRGKRGRGGRGRARSGRGRGCTNNETSHVEVLPEGEDRQASGDTNEDGDATAPVDTRTQDGKDSAKILVRSGSKRLRKLKSRKRWILKKVGSKSSELIELDQTPEKPARAQPAAEKELAQDDEEPKPKPSHKPPGPKEKKKPVDEKKQATREQAKALSGSIAVILGVGGGEATRDGDFACKLARTAFSKCWWRFSMPRFYPSSQYCGCYCR